MAFTNRVDTVTLDFLVPRVVDTVLRGNTFTTSMLAKTKKFRSSTMDFPIKYQKGISGTSFAGFDTLPTSASDTRVLMIYNPRFYANNVALPLTEIAANATVQKVMDLATVEMRSRAQDCADSDITGNWCCEMGSQSVCDNVTSNTSDVLNFCQAWIAGLEGQWCAASGGIPIAISASATLNGSSVGSVSQNSCP